MNMLAYAAGKMVWVKQLKWTLKHATHFTFLKQVALIMFNTNLMIFSNPQLTATDLLSSLPWSRHCSLNLVPESSIGTRSSGLKFLVSCSFHSLDQFFGDPFKFPIQ